VEKKEGTIILLIGLLFFLFVTSAQYLELEVNNNKKKKQRRQNRRKHILLLFIIVDGVTVNEKQENLAARVCDSDDRCDLGWLQVAVGDFEVTPPFFFFFSFLRPLRYL
jgi:hypothetical protein